jgi:hypothetical protein
MKRFIDLQILLSYWYLLFQLEKANVKHLYNEDYTTIL